MNRQRFLLRAGAVWFLVLIGDPALSQNRGGEPIISQVEWTVPITMELQGGGQDMVKFGTRMGATNSLDPGIDVLNPPLPPGAADAFFEITHPLFPFLSEDYRSDQQNMHEWNFRILQTQGLSGALYWDTANFPGSIPGVHLEIRAGGTLLADMLVQDSVNFTGDQNLTVLYEVSTPLYASPLASARFILHQNYPNPFNSQTTIRFELPEKQTVSLVVYDALGRKIETIIKNKPLEAGEHRITWEAGRYASGVYFLVMSAGGFTSQIKLIALE